MREYDYPSVICEYCRYTNCGEFPCEYNTPYGYDSCEGCNCDEALDNYNEENKDNKLTMEELF